MTCKQKSSCREEYSISSAEKIACRNSSLLNTRPAVRSRQFTRKRVLPVPGQSRHKTIIIQKAETKA